MSTSSTSSVSGGQTLGKDAFLQLLAIQMQNQDPLSPMDNSQFIAQLAQFSSLEQLTNIAAETTSIATTQQMSSAFSLLGAQVTVTDSSSNSTVSGAVTAVNSNGGQINVVVNGVSYPLTSVISIS